MHLQPNTLATVQIKKSHFQANLATYGAGAFVTSDNTPVVPAPATCSALASTDGPLQAVLFNETQFLSNLCAPPGVGAGASLFWDQQYSVDIICPGSVNPTLADSSQLAMNSSDTSVAAMIVGASCPQGTQQLCSQCLRVEGCAAWSGNRGGLLESARYAQMQTAPPAPVSTGNTSASPLPAAIVPLALRRRRHGQSAATRFARRLAKGCPDVAHSVAGRQRCARCARCRAGLRTRGAEPRADKHRAVCRWLAAERICAGALEALCCCLRCLRDVQFVFAKAADAL